MDSIHWICTRRGYAQRAEVLIVSWQPETVEIGGISSVDTDSLIEDVEVLYGIFGYCEVVDLRTKILRSWNRVAESGKVQEGLLELDGLRKLNWIWATNWPNLESIEPFKFQCIDALEVEIKIKDLAAIRGVRDSLRQAQAVGCPLRRKIVCVPSSILAVRFGPSLNLTLNDVPWLKG